MLGLYVGRAHFSTSVAALLLPLLAGIAAFGIMVMRKGRCLSLLRWGPGQVPANIPSPHHAHTPGDHRWMSVVANLINDS